MTRIPRKSRPDIRQIKQRLETASSHQTWLEAAAEHDRYLGGDTWRQRENSSLYGSAEIRIRHDKLRKLIDANEFHDLLYALNEGIHGNMCGMGRPVLYHRALTGTKALIDDYVNVIIEALNHIADCPESLVPKAEKIDFFRRASHCYGRSSLMLSGGAGLIYFHHGVVQTLVDEDALPNILSGASAGSWLCAQIGTRSDAEMKAGYFDNFRYDLPTHLNPWRVLAGLEEEANPVTVKERAIDSFCPEMTFQEAYEHTGRYINISIAPAEKHQNSRLLNAITSPNVYIRSAIDASGSVPGVVPPVTLYAKGADGKPKPYLPTRKWVDGSFAQDLPAKRLARLFGVNHYIVSLINPLAVPFVNDLKALHKKRFRDVGTSILVNSAKDALMALEGWGSRLKLPYVSPAILMLHALLDQEYTGDINIMLADRDFRWMNVLFDYRDDDEIANLILAGKRATWPRLAQIRNSIIIGRTLDQILERLDAGDVGAMPQRRNGRLTLAV